MDRRTKMLGLVVVVVVVHKPLDKNGSRRELQYANVFNYLLAVEGFITLQFGAKLV